MFNPHKCTHTQYATLQQLPATKPKANIELHRNEMTNKTLYGEQVTAKEPIRQPCIMTSKNKPKSLERTMTKPND